MSTVRISFLRNNFSWAALPMRRRTSALPVQGIINGSSSVSKLNVPFVGPISLLEGVHPGTPLPLEKSGDATWFRLLPLGLFGQERSTRQRSRAPAIRARLLDIEAKRFDELPRA